VSGTFCRNGPKGASHKRCLTPFPHLLDEVTRSKGAQERVCSRIRAESGGAALTLRRFPEFCANSVTFFRPFCSSLQTCSCTRSKERCLTAM